MKNECVEELKKTILPHVLSFLNIEEFIDSWASNVVVISKKDLNKKIEKLEKLIARGESIDNTTFEFREFWDTHYDAPKELKFLERLRDGKLKGVRRCKKE